MIIGLSRDLAFIYDVHEIIHLKGNTNLRLIFYQVPRNALRLLVPQDSAIKIDVWSSGTANYGETASK